MHITEVNEERPLRMGDYRCIELQLVLDGAVFRCKDDSVVLLEQG